ncbi:MAG: biotin--[acetyl-CoA-carboxylase] ligase, partial [Pseudomonadota bacterium]
MLDPNALEAAIRAELPEVPVSVLESVGSTNQWLLDRSENENGDRFCLALEQTSGRGRRGKSWRSPVGNFYGSASLPLAADAAEMGPFSLAVATVVAEVLEQLGIANVRLKWPNDVCVADKKIAGILLELSQHRTHHGGRRQQRVVVGIGLNVVPVKDDVGQSVTSLQDCLG